MKRALLLAILGLAGAPAWAGDFAVLQAGETVEQLAARLGMAAEAAAIRSLNGLAPDSAPPPGTLVELPHAGSDGQNEAVVLALQGTGTLSPPGGPTAALALAARVTPGSVLCTGVDSYATVRLAVDEKEPTHDDVSLMPETCITVAAASASRGRRSALLKLERGSLTVQSTAAGASPGLVAVETEDGITAGDAGGFRVHKEQGSSRTEALYAPLRVFGAGVQQQLRAGEGSRVKFGEAPGPAHALPLSGRPIAPPDGAPLRRSDFDWQPGDRALSYLVVLSATPDFRDVVYMQEVAETRWRPEMLMLPVRLPGLWWQVASVDRTGFVGVPSPGRSLVIPSGVGP